MKNLKNILLITFLLLFSNFLIFGQNQDEVILCKRFKKITTKSKSKEGQVYVDYNTVDSTRDVHVFLVNRSNDPLRTSGIKRRVSFSCEAKDANGGWKRLDVVGGGCGHDYGEFSLPAKTYTWETKQKKFFNDGKYSTELRFLYYLKDTVLISRSINAKIDSTRFLPHQLRYLAKKDERLLKGELTPEQEQRYLNHKARVLLEFDRIKESFEISKKLLQKYPQYFAGKYRFGLLLMQVVRKNETISRITQITLTAKAIEVWKTIPRSFEKFDKVQKLIELSDKYLPTKEELELLEKHDCEFINGAYHCFNALLDETVIISLKNSK